MNLQDLTLKQFLEKTAGNEPVPGGGSISALNGAIAAALGEMLASLTIGKKNYSEVEDTMKHNALQFSNYRKILLDEIDRDSEAYTLVSNAFKLPKDTDEEKAIRSQRIQEATQWAATVPMEIAERAFEMLSLLINTTQLGNKNAVTDGLVALMTCRTAILGALLNVRINLSSIKDHEFVKTYTDKCDYLERETIKKEEELIAHIKPQL